MKVLVTGGLGFIGSNLVPELKKRGHEVWVCDLTHSESPNHIRCDTSQYHQMERIFNQHDFDYVYHLAAEYGRWNGEDYYENLWMTNVIGTKNILRIQEQKKFRMIFFSSAEVYGDYEGVMSEDIMDKVPIKQMNDYAIVKWAGELQCLNSADMFGTETVRVRPVGCYGPHEYYSRYRGVIPIFTYSCLKNRPFKIYRGHKRIFDYVEDTCRTFANIVDNFIPGESYNVGSDEEWVTDIEGLAQIILEETGANPGLAEYHDAEAFTTRVKIVDFSKSRRDLNHEAHIDIRNGVKRYVKWMRSVYGQ